MPTLSSNDRLTGIYSSNTDFEALQTDHEKQDLLKVLQQSGDLLRQSNRAWLQQYGIIKTTLENMLWDPALIATLPTRLHFQKDFLDAMVNISISREDTWEFFEDMPAYDTPRIPINYRLTEDALELVEQNNLHDDMEWLENKIFQYFTNFEIDVMNFEDDESMLSISVYDPMSLSVFDEKSDCLYDLMVAQNRSRLYDTIAIAPCGDTCGS